MESGTSTISYVCTLTYCTIQLVIPNRDKETNFRRFTAGALAGEPGPQSYLVIQSYSPQA